MISCRNMLTALCDENAYTKEIKIIILHICAETCVISDKRLGIMRQSFGSTSFFTLA